MKGKIIYDEAIIPKMCSFVGYATLCFSLMQIITYTISVFMLKIIITKTVQQSITTQ
jgi:hypothetical protein